MIQGKEAGEPVEIVYPTEGTPLATSPSAVFKARAQSECGAAVPELDARARGPADPGRLRAAVFARTRQTVEKPGVRKLADIKLMKEDPEASRRRATRSRRATRKIFGV